MKMKLLSALFALFAGSACSVDPNEQAPKQAPKSPQQWPKTTAPDKSDPYWEFNNNLNSNGTPYHKVERSPGEWEWAVDEDVLKAMTDSEEHRKHLYKALRTRVLNDEELKEALAYGDHLNIAPFVSYDPVEKSKELNDAFVTQHKLALQERQFKSGTFKP